MVDDSIIKMLVGWSMIVFICLMLAFNLVLIIFDLAYFINLCCIKVYRKFIKRLTKWIINTYLGLKPYQEPSIQELIEIEKEKI